MQDLKVTFKDRRKLMLEEKINLAKFMTWLIGSYPESLNKLRDYPDYQYNFR
jgi:hypothetical protein